MADCETAELDGSDDVHGIRNPRDNRYSRNGRNLLIPRKLLDFGLNHAKLIDLWDCDSKVWWNRLWIVQETVLAKRAIVNIGQSAMPWTEFASLVTDVSFRDWVPAPLDMKRALKRCTIKKRPHRSEPGRSRCKPTHAFPPLREYELKFDELPKLCHFDGNELERLLKSFSKKTSCRNLDPIWK